MAVRADEHIGVKCFDPSGDFLEFPKEDVETSIPERFEKIVRNYRDRLAVKTPSHSLTYGDLNVTANHMARALLAEQKVESNPVALLFDKDAPLIAAMLGVLKAGKFFVLLDPSFPRQRIAALLENSQAELMVTDQQNASLGHEVASSCHRLLDFGSIDLSIPIKDHCVLISPDTLAFIVYTSGSTGQPKGVIQNHRNVLRNIMQRTNAGHVSPQDRVSLLTSGTANTICFTFLALLNGAALFPFDPKKQGVNGLVSWLSQAQISICPISSLLFRNLCETLTGKEAFPHLRLIRLTSEAAYQYDVELYKKHFSPGCMFSTGLSTSETGVLTNYTIDPRIEFCGGKVPLGYVTDDTEILLLDDQGELVACNEVGEIVVSSRYLSPGYWKRPKLAQAKFKPQSGDCDKRLYFTGDLGRMLPDGCLIHEGRKDFRVQIRGYGVEIEEIEMALLDHPAIRDAVVIGRQIKLGEARLVAYSTASGEIGPGASELRQFLKSKLPGYMVPSAFVRLDAIPLASSGKVDRKALPVPDNSRPDLDVLFVAPRSPTEEKLATIWAEVLDIQQVGVHDNFFDLGGDSLNVSQIVSRVFQHFQLQIPLQALFESPTVAEMASVIKEHQSKKLSGNELEQILTEVESLSDEEAQKCQSESSSAVAEKG